MTVYGYARVSTIEQDTALQIEALQSAGAGLIFQEKISGKDRNRPELERLLLLIKKGDLLLVYKLDRLARSLSDLLHILEVLETKGARFKSLTEPIQTDNYLGKFMLQILGAVAELERNLIRERAIAGQQAAIVRGVHCGRAPSYTREDFLRVWELRGEGLTMREIGQRVGLGVNVVKRILYGSNKSYRG